MFHKPWPVLLCALLLPVTAGAAELDSSGSYCFRAEDFSREELSGICLTRVPGQGAMKLGSRELRPGDVLTAGQLDSLTFSPGDPETGGDFQIGYLPIFDHSVAEETTLNLSLRGREDKPPVAEDSALETYKNLANTGKLKAHDPEGQQLTFTVTRQPRRGTVELGEDGSFTYTPRHNKVGVDSFTYTAADPAGKVSREATVTVTILRPMDAARYTDTAGQDCCFAAEWMRNTGIFTGEALAGNACFSPEKNVTRGEFVSMLVKTLEIPVEEDVTYTGCTDEVPQWLRPYLAAAVRSGLTAGLPARETFGAGEEITGGEAAAMIAAALDLEEEAMAREDLLPEAEAPVTRAQTALVLYRVRQLLDGKDTLPY